MQDIEAGPEAAGGAEENLVGRRVGHFRIVGKLGAGGYGTVWDGIDETLGRQVALKAIAANRLLGDARARLAREARLLSRLEDSKICRIYEYVRDAERDYLVLERVTGKTLQQILRREPNRFSFRAKLSIAEQLLDVLVRTHAEGVVHRDLKPANLMLTADDQLKVLDFGIALVDEEEEQAPTTSFGMTSARVDSGRTLLETRRGRILGTAFYLSPEQARGERATPASDMYALGLVLQELFTGVGPHPSGLTEDQLVARAMVAKSEPVTGLAPALTQLIEALKSGEANRRPSAAEARLALQRILEKPQRLRRWALAAAALLAAAAAGGVHTARLGKERDAALTARTEARQVANFMTSLFSLADPNEAQGRTITAEELLRRGAARIDSELGEQPLVKARLEQTIGEVYRELGLYEESGKFLRGALARRRAALPPNDPALADNLRALGVLLTTSARYDEARSVLHESLAIAEKVDGPDQLLVAAIHQNLGELERQLGKWPEAEAELKQALSIFERHPAEREGLTRSLSNLAGVYWRIDRFDDAEPLLKRVLALEEASLGLEHPRLARTLNNLGLIAQQRQNQPEAEAFFRRALAIKEKALGPEHPELASTIYNLGISRKELGDLEGALAQFQRALALDEKAHGPDHPNVAFTLTGVGTVLRDLGRLSEAEAAFTRALAILDRALPGHPAREEVLREWGKLKKLQGGL